MNLKSLFSLCNATPQRAVNPRRQRSDLYVSFFARNGEEEILKDKKKPCD